MAESLVQVPPDSTGKKMHTYARAIGANTVEDEIVLHGEPYLPSYTQCMTAMSGATANSHLCELMAGAALVVYVRQIRIYQVALATAAAIVRWQVGRLTTAGTGGTAQAAAQALDSTDAACGATCMTLPTVKGTEAATSVRNGTFGVIQTAPTAGPLPLVAVIDFSALRHKSLRIPIGVANGIHVKNIDAAAATTFHIEIDFVEATF